MSAQAHEDLPARIETGARRHVMRRPGGQVVWRVWGGGGRPLVLLHGASGAWSHWIRNVPALSAHRLVIVPDMPGFGASDLLPATHTAEALTALVAEGVSEIVASPQEFDLAGFSFGGIIAGLVAARLGARVRTLAMFGPGGLGLPRPAMPPLVPVQRDMVADAQYLAHLDNLRTLMIGDPAKADALAVSIQVENLRLARFRSGSIPESDVLLRALPAIRARIVTVWGERDAFAGGDLEARRRLLAPFQSASDFRVIADAGHWTPYETPETVNAILQAL